MPILYVPFKLRSKSAIARNLVPQSLRLPQRGVIDDPAGLSCSVQTGSALVKAGLHPATGGDGMLACSGDMLLQALVACAGVTVRAVATATGIDVRGGAVHAEGDLDFRGTLGVDREVPVGFKNIRLTFDLDTDATTEQIATLRKLTERLLRRLSDSCGRRCAANGVPYARGRRSNGLGTLRSNR